MAGEERHVTTHYCPSMEPTPNLRDGTKILHSKAELNSLRI